MASSIISKSAFNYAGRLAGLLKPYQFTGLQKSSSYFSMLSANLQCVPLRHSQPLGHKFYRNIEICSSRCINTNQYPTTLPYMSSNELRRSKGIPHSCYTETFNVLNGTHPTLRGFSMAHQIRFISSQKRSSKKGEVLIRKEPLNLDKSVRNSRRNSEKAGDRQFTRTSGDETTLPKNPEEEEKLTLYQRFKKTYKEHGKVLVAVHVTTSVVWFSVFYTAASLGFDIVPLLESWNLSERVISPFRSGGLGNVALAYLLYKLATPARYTVTIAGTRYAIGYLQKEGKMKVVPKSDSLRSLYREGKEDIKGRSKRRISSMRRKSRVSKKQRNNNEEISDKL
ncbi:hypothetical protein EGW08_002876 [Elysia chlorotica]|uniref:DUF1279 domain-containing protein n=1 Tax=Elysia chlorotica TaxID=188477 RepID=A0A3S1BQW3_ELYCH|nr:hypothetical protein EGW08_002876 [Elysia chlorotica]